VSAQSNRRTATRTTIIFAIIILVPALIGFAVKFREFLLLVRYEEGAFTIMPILNYMLVSLGFLFLFVWAVMHGMFRDMEKPKYDMLEQQRELDEEWEERKREREEEERWHESA
jgi:hypothetical protein